MPTGALWRMLFGGKRSSTVLSRSPFWWKTGGSGGILTDGAGLHAIQLGSAAGADTNDPLFLPLGASGQYLYFPGVGGNNATTPNAAALNITGDLDLRARVAMDDWTPAAESVFLNKGPIGASGYYFSVAPSGALNLYWFNGAASVFKGSTVATGVTDGSLKWIRATLDVDNGAGGNTVTFYTSDDGVAWTVLGAPVVTAGVTSITAATGVLAVGSLAAGANVCAGKFYRAQVYNGIGGTLVFDANFANAVEPFSTFAESSPNAATVTINRSASGRKATMVDRDQDLLGTDDEVLIADADDLDVPAGQSFTVFALVRQYATPTNTGRYAANQTTGAGYRLSSNGVSIQSLFQVSDGTNSASATGPAFSAGVLTLVAGVRDTAAGKIRCYADGFGADVSDPSGDLSNALSLAFGARSDGASFQDFVIVGGGVIREALSAADLARVKAELL
jgi:hypothetical protein